MPAGKVLVVRIEEVDERPRRRPHPRVASLRRTAVRLPHDADRFAERGQAILGERIGPVQHDDDLGRHRHLTQR
jgi:hypothetical protein